MLYPRHTGGAVPLRFLVKTAITAVTPPVVFHSISPTRHTRLPHTLKTGDIYMFYFETRVF